MAAKPENRKPDYRLLCVKCGKRTGVYIKDLLKHREKEHGIKYER